MRQIFLLILLAALVLASCSEIASPQTPSLQPETPGAASQPQAPTPTSPPLTSMPTGLLPTPTSTRQPAAATASPSPAPSLPHDRLLIAYQSRSPEQRLILLNPSDGSSFEFDFPPGAIFATPFLDGLSPDARHFVFYEGGTEEEYGGLNAEPPDFGMRVFNLDSREVIFSTPLLSPEFPEVLKPIVEMTEDEYWMLEPDREAKLKDMYETMQATVLNHLRTVAWSPDSSLLAFPSQDPGPTSDLYLFSPELGTAQRVIEEPGHVLKTIWTPSSSALVTESSLYDRHAREASTYLLAREGPLLASFKSQRMFFNNWHDSSYGFLYEGTDSGDFYDLKTLSAADGTITMLFEGTYADIAYSPDLSTFLLSSNIPTAPIPAHAGLYLGKRGDSSLRTLSEIMGWEVEYWGSEKFAFAASSFDDGTIGVTQNGEVVTIDDGYWKLVASPSGRYLAGYFKSHPSYRQGIVPGLRIFDGDGQLLEFIDDTDITCVSWNVDSTVLAYQAESRLYLWDAATGSTRLISDQLNEAECAFKWVLDTSFRS